MHFEISDTDNTIITAICCNCKAPGSDAMSASVSVSSPQEYQVNYKAGELGVLLLNKKIHVNNIQVFISAIGQN